MRVAWLVNDDYDPDTTIGTRQMKEIGPLWGASKSWRRCSTDNVVCVDLNAAQQLVTRAFQAVCNLYVPLTIYGDLGRPKGVKVFDAPRSANPRIAAATIISGLSDTVLLVGFSLTEATTRESEQFQKELLRIFKDNPDVQWVVLDHEGVVSLLFSDLGNLWFDSIDNVTALLS